MTPDQIRRSWDDDDTPRSVFPEPLAERLTRENKELRAENERVAATALTVDRELMEARAEVERAALDRDGAIRRAAAEIRLRDASEVERGRALRQLDALVADLRGLVGEWNRLMGWPRNVGAPALAFVLDKHAGEQAQPAGGER